MRPRLCGASGGFLAGTAAGFRAGGGCRRGAPTAGYRLSLGATGKRREEFRNRKVFVSAVEEDCPYRENREAESGHLEAKPALFARHDSDDCADDERDNH